MVNYLPAFDATRISRSTGDLRPPLTLIANTGLQSAGPVASDIVVVGDVLAAAFADGTLRGFDTSDLSERWRVALPEGQIPSRFHGAPMAVGDTFVLQSAERWHRHDSTTGALIETFHAPAMALRRGIARGQTILSTWWQDDSAHLGLYDVSAKVMRWSHPIEGSAAGIITQCQGVSALALSDTCLGGFDTDNGNELWRCDISSIGIIDGPFAAPTGLIDGWPVCVSGLFLLPVCAGHWIGIEPDTGAIRWRCKLNVKAPGVAACVASHVICLSEGFVAAFDPADGNLLWETPFGDPGHGHYGAPIVSGGHVWAVGARDGRVLALDGCTGIPIWYGPDGGLTPPDRLPIVIQDRLITANDDGVVRVFHSES